MRPRMYGSTDIQVFRTRISPDPRRGSSTSAISKFEWVTAPFGRLANRISREKFFILQVLYLSCYQELVTKNAICIYDPWCIEKFNSFRKGYEKINHLDELAQGTTTRPTCR